MWARGKMNHIAEIKSSTQGCWELAWLVKEIKGPSIREQRANCLISLSAWVVFPWGQGGRWKGDKWNKWSSPLGGGFSLRARASGCTATCLAARAPGLGCFKRWTLADGGEYPGKKSWGTVKEHDWRELFSLLQAPLPHSFLMWF